MTQQGEAQNLDREILYNLQKILQHLIAFETSFNEYKAWCKDESATLRHELATHSIAEVNAINDVKSSVNATKDSLDVLKTSIESDIVKQDGFRNKVSNWIDTHNMP